MQVEPMKTTWGVVRFTGFEFEELKPIQEAVTGVDFVKAWAEIVRCHRFLHEKGFEQNDPSLWDMMYNSRSRCGVLTDFDHALPSGSSYPSGLWNTGTVPFTALELLSPQYWEGKVLRRYRHELEALIWVLAFVLLRFDNKCLGEDKANTVGWMTSNYNICLKKKFSILSTHFPVQDSFKRQKALGLQLTAWIVNSNSKRLLDSELEYEAQSKDILSKGVRVNEDKEIWREFLASILPLVNHFPELQEVIT